MKKILLIASFFLFNLLTLQAQPGERSEKVESLRIAFITKQLQLTPDEAKGFWPVYNQYDKEMRDIMREHRQKGGKQLELEEKILNLHKKHKPNFTKVISEGKFDRLMVAERTWGEMVRKELQRRKQGGGRFENE